VFAAIKSSAASEAAILIQGESGTGKELVAGAIHYHSERSDKPLVTVNCSALSESLLESELFGHVKGAFTGAYRDRMGRFEEADGGTIFLDEIGEISPLIQVKLLRVLQELEIERVGESKRRKIDIRLISPLRHRKEDIPLLADHFIHRYNQKTGMKIQSITQNAMRVIMDYEWPGNVRELENAIEHAFVLSSQNRIDVFDLPVEVRQTGYHPASYLKNLPSRSRAKLSYKLTREKLIEVLNESGWNKAEAARRLGLNRTVVWRYMKKWDIPLQKL
jgi:transcriptional regulator with GAF, ATPase, and Fis domain